MAAVSLATERRNPDDASDEGDEDVVVSKKVAETQCVCFFFYFLSCECPVTDHVRLSYFINTFFIYTS